MTSQTKAILSYSFFFFSGIFFLATEKEDKLTKLSAAQSTVLSLFFIIANAIFRFIPLFGYLFSSVLTFAFFISWILLIIKASQNIYLKIPFISYISEKYLAKI